MATTRIMPLHIGKGRTESQAVSDIIDYVSNPQKTDYGRLVTGFACDSRVADAEFLLVKREYICLLGMNPASTALTLLSEQRTGMYLKSYADRQRGRRTDGRPQTDRMLWMWQLQAGSAADSFTG